MKRRVGFISNSSSSDWYEYDEEEEEQREFEFDVLQNVQEIKCWKNPTKNTLRCLLISDFVNGVSDSQEFKNVEKLVLEGDFQITSYPNSAGFLSWTHYKKRKSTSKIQCRFTPLLNELECQEVEEFKLVKE